MFETFAHAAASTSPKAAKTGDNAVIEIHCQRVRRGDQARFWPDRIGTVYDAGHERSERRLHLRRRDVAAKPGDDADLAGRIRAEQVLVRDRPVHRDRHEQIHRAVAEPGKFRPRDADDREPLAVDVERPAEDRRVAIEQPAPSLIGQHGHGRATWRDRVERRDRSPEPQADAQRVEVVARHERGLERAALRGHQPRGLGNHIVEEIATAAELLVVAPLETAAGVVLRAPEQLVQRVGIAHRERPEHIRVEDREDDRDEREADGERQHCGRGKRRVGAKAAPRVAHIL